MGGRIVKVTNPDKVLFPARRETKRDLVDYYLSVGEGIVRALYERPTQLRRFPDGVEGEQIYQKRVPEKRPDWIEVGARDVPLRPARRRALRDGARARRVGREPRGRRLPSLAVAAPRRRPARRAADRHRPAAGNDVRRRRSRSRPSSARRSPRSGRRAGRRRPATAASTSRAGSSRTGSSRSSAAARSRSRARSSGAPRPRDDRVVEGGARRARLHRLQPERARPDDRLRLLGARPRPTRPCRRR